MFAQLLKKSAIGARLNDAGLKAEKEKKKQACEDSRNMRYSGHVCVFLFCTDGDKIDVAQIKGKADQDGDKEERGPNEMGFAIER